MSNYEQISKQAEADLNTYQAKTGSSRPQADDDAGINSVATKKFQVGDVTTGDELSTNAGYNKRIPPSEGGVVDDKGRQATGQQYEGRGGPLDDFEQTGRNDNDVVGARPDNQGLGGSGDILQEGMAATRTNVGRNPPGPGGSAYKGENYFTPESVPDSISAEGWIAPESVTESSREAERP